MSVVQLQVQVDLQLVLTVDMGFHLVIPNFHFLHTMLPVVALLPDTLKFIMVAMSMVACRPVVIVNETDEELAVQWKDR